MENSSPVHFKHIEMSESYTDRMREFASIMIEALDQTKRQVFQAKKDIDCDFPAWQARRDEFPDDYLQHEARREFFVTLITLVENAQLSYMLLGDNLTDDSWWSSKLENVSEDKRTSVLHEYAIMVKWFLTHGLFMAVEDTLRSIQRAAPDVFPVSGRFRSIAKVTSSILQESGNQQYSDLFLLTRLTRNTIHTNGVHLPEDESDQEIQYANETFPFKYGMIIEWLNDQRAIWFINHLSKAMKDIIRAPSVSNIEYCPRTQAR